MGEICRVGKHVRQELCALHTARAGTGLGAWEILRKKQRGIANHVLAAYWVCCSIEMMYSRVSGTISLIGPRPKGSDLRDE